MELKFEDLKKLIIENGTHVSPKREKTENYFLENLDDAGIKYGTCIIAKNGNISFVNIPFNICYKPEDNTICQYMLNTVDETSLFISPLKFDETGVYSQNTCYYFFTQDTKNSDIIEHHVNLHLEEVKKELSDKIKTTEETINTNTQKIKQMTKDNEQYAVNIKNIKKILEKVSMPDFMKGMRRGDLFETRCGMVVRIDFFSKSTGRPSFDVIRTVAKYPDFVKDQYGYSTDMSGRFDKARNHDFDIVKKLKKSDL